MTTRTAPSVAPARGVLRRRLSGLIRGAGLLGACAVGLGACALQEGRTPEQLAASVTDIAFGAPGSRGAVDPATQVSVPAGAGFDDAVRAAVLGSPALAAAIGRYDEAEARVNVAASGRQPQVRGTVNAGGVIEGSDELTGASGDLTVLQVIADGGALRAQVDAASARAFGARAAAVEEANSVARDAATAWVDVWQYDNQLALLRSRLADLDPWLERMDGLVEGGITDRASVAAVQRQILDVRLQEETLVASRKSAAEQFERHFGRPPGRLAQPGPRMSASSLRALRNGAWQSAPELLAAASELLAAESDLAVAEARLSPNVSLRSGINAPLSNVEEPTLSLGIAVEHDFFDGGRRTSEIDARRARLTAQERQFEDAREEARVALEASLARYDASVQSRAVVDRQIEVIRNEVDALSSQLTAGGSSLRDYVEALIRLYRAEFDRIDSSGRIVRAELEAVAGAGKLLETLRIDPEQLF